MSYYNQHGQPITAAAYHALRAAAMRRSIGRYAAMRYYLKHSGRTSIRLFRIACQLTAIERDREASSS